IDTIPCGAPSYAGTKKRDASDHPFYEEEQTYLRLACTALMKRFRPSLRIDRGHAILMRRKPSPSFPNMEPSLKTTPASWYMSFFSTAGSSETARQSTHTR